MENGWIVHVIADHFPDDAQDVTDPEWIRYGLERGWSLLTQDLDSAELPVQVRAGRFQQQRNAIWQHVVDRRVGFFVVQESGPPRRRRWI